MSRLPDVIFVIDSNKEQIAVKEARKLGIPVVAMVDTNCDPDEVDYVIPGNDDALRAIRLFTSKISESIAEGAQLMTDKQVADMQAASDAAQAAETARGEAARARSCRGGCRRKKSAWKKCWARERTRSRWSAEEVELPKAESQTV